MFEGFWDWLGDWRNVVMLFLLIVIPSSLCMLMLNDQRIVAEAKAIETPDGVYFMLGGLELWDLAPDNYTFDVVLENPYIYPVMLSWVSESELIEYVDYSCSLSDGSLIEANSNVTSTVDVTILPNPYNSTGVFKLYGKGGTP